MKIAIFTDVFLEVPGGIPSSIKAQREYLAKAGHSSIVFCPATPGTEVPEGVFGVPSFRFLRPGGAPFAKRIKKVKRAILEAYPEFDFDLVHIHYEGACSLAGAQLAREFGKPLVQTMHGREDVAAETNIPHPVKTLGGVLLCWLHKFGVPHPIKVRRDDYLAPTVVRAKMWTLMVNQANFADVVITPSRHFREKLQHYGVTKPFVVISNAISDEALKESFKAAGLDYERPAVRKYEGGVLRLFWNSRVSKEKRMGALLEAMRLLGAGACRDGDDCGRAKRGSETLRIYKGGDERGRAKRGLVRLEVYGDGNDLGRAKRFAERFGLEVRFYGRVEHTEMLRKMATAEMAVVVSYGFDNQPMTILEARAMGLPTLICDPDLQEVTGAGGLLADGPEPEALARAIAEVMSRPELLEDLSRACLRERKEILQSEQIKKLIKLYQSLG